MKLDEFRQRLSDIDAKILDLVAERQAVGNGLVANGLTVDCRNMPLWHPTQPPESGIATARR